MLNSTINKNYSHKNFSSSVFEQNFLPVKTQTTYINNQQKFSTNKKDSFFSNNSDILNASVAVGTAGSLTVAQALVRKLAEAFSHMLMAGKEFTSAENVKKVANAMKENNGLKAGIHFIDNANKDVLKKQFPSLASNLDIVANGKNAFYTNLKNFAVAPKTKPSLILHELGHAINNEKSTIGKALQKCRKIGYSAPAILLLANHFFGKPKKDGEETFLEKHAGKIGFAAFIPTLIEEGVASMRGVKAAQQTLGKNANLGILKRNYFFAWMTYMLGAVGIGIASKLAVKQNNQSKEKSSKQFLNQ